MTKLAAPGAALAALLSIAVAASTSCTIRPGEPPGGDSGGPGAGGGGGAGGNSNLSPRELFEQTVQPGLLENCKACHLGGGIADFLAPPDVYASIAVYKSITTDRPLLWPVPEESVLYWFPDSADHTGTQYGAELADLKAAVLEWLKVESKSLPPPEEAQQVIIPVKPIPGFNTIYLDPLGPAFKSSAITFEAEELNPTLLKITKLKVQPADATAIRMVHPRFVVYPEGSASPIIDPIDSLASVDHTWKPQEDPTLGPGEVYLSFWQSGARLSLDIDPEQGRLEAFFLGADGQIIVPCKDLTSFKAAILGLGDGGPQYCAKTCHGGKREEAKAAMNLLGLIEDPPNYDFACAVMRSRTTPGDVDASDIMMVTNPAAPQVIHMYKFDGDQKKYDAFKSGMKTWITKEGQ